jgi:hypothetical protein
MGTPAVRDKIRATKVGKPLHPNMIAAQREAARRPKSPEWKQALSERMKRIWESPEAHGLPPCHRWTDEEVALLGTDLDSVIAGRLGVARHIVENKRRRLGVSTQLGRSRRDRLGWANHKPAHLFRLSGTHRTHRLGQYIMLRTPPVPITRVTSTRVARTTGCPRSRSHTRIEGQAGLR